MTLLAAIETTQDLLVIVGLALTVGVCIGVVVEKVVVAWHDRNGERDR